MSAEENYGLLGYDPAEITLGSEHTRWVDEHSLLRTQTTSQIPAALQQAAERRQPGQTVLLAAPGITFRRDSRDRWHCAEPHQMDIWLLGDPDLASHEHLLRLVGDILQSAVPDRSWVYSDSPHHYTEGGIEVNVLNDNVPVEVLECGRIAKTLLQRLQIDPLRHGGLALGMGLDRLTMLRKGIPDIRLLRDPNDRVRAQMHDLNPWAAVSRLPSIARDISLAVSPGLSEEVLTERMLQAAGDCSHWIEEMRIKGRWRGTTCPRKRLSDSGCCRVRKTCCCMSCCVIVPAQLLPARRMPCTRKFRLQCMRGTGSGVQDGLVEGLKLNCGSGLACESAGSAKDYFD